MRSLPAIVFVGCVLAAYCGASAAWEQIWIPAKDGAQAIRLEATLYKPAGAGPFPVVLFSHGATGRGAIPPTFPLRPHNEAAVFTRMGYVVVAPMRRGRGASGGVYRESYECDAGAAGVEDAVADTDAVMAYLRGLPFVDTSRIILAGISRGGFLSVMYAERRPAGVGAVINFVGGWHGDRCVSDFNTRAFRRAASATTVPMLWLYAENDHVFRVDSIKSFKWAFFEGGGNLEFRLYPSPQRHGHMLPKYVDVWQSDAETFLKFCCGARRLD